MKPVMRALQTIAALQTETRDGKQHLRGTGKLGLISGTGWSLRPLVASHVMPLQLSPPRCH
jgi:hypothetical protein